MKLFGSIIIFLFIIKIYSSNSYHERLRENEQLINFIEYDLDREQWERLTIDQTFTILGLAKSDSSWHNASEEIISKLKSTTSLSLEEIILIFNTSELRSLIKYPTTVYVENNGLSKKHNRLIASSVGYSNIISKMFTIKKPIQEEKPYVYSLLRGKDSMDLRFTYAMHGEIDNALLYYNDDTIKVNSLPINIGPIKGEVTFSIRDSTTDERICYKQNFYY